MDVCKIKAIYAIYRGDIFIDLGTLDELSKKFNVKKKTIEFYCSPTYQKRKKDYNKGIIVIRLENENE